MGPLQIQQNGHWNSDHEELLHTPQNWSLTISCSLVSYPGHLGGGWKRDLLFCRRYSQYQESLSRKRWFFTALKYSLYKTNKSILFCYICSTSEIGDAPLYNSCFLPIQIITARTITGLPQITGTCPGWWKQSFRLRLWSLVWFQVRATSCHLTSLKSAWKSTPKCTWMCWRVWWSPGAIRWPVQTLGVAAGLGASPQVQRDPGLASERVLRLCTLLSLPPLPWPETAALLRLVICWEHHQHDLPQHQSQPDHCHLPSIRRAPAGTCGKGMLPVPDPYRGGDWGWRWLHWIDVSSTT